MRRMAPDVMPMAFSIPNSAVRSNTAITKAPITLNVTNTMRSAKMG